MEIAKLILEYIKVLAWPLVTLLLVLRFKKPLADILRTISKKFATSETIKLDVFGQEVELSNTAKELKQEQIKLLETHAQNPSAREKAEQLKQAIPELNNPITDLVGITLLKDVKSGLTIDDILADVIQTFIPESQQKTEKIGTTKLILLSMSRDVEKILQQLTKLQLVHQEGNRYILSDDGNKLFTKVEARQQSVLEKLNTR